MQKEETFLNAALSIYTRISELARTTEKGIFWESVSNRGGGRMVVEVREDLYAGSAGIILYLLELYRLTGRQPVKNTLMEAVAWLMDHCDQHAPGSFALYTGRSGVAYVLVKMHLQFNEDRYLTAAKKYMRQSNELFRKDTSVLGDDLINGTAGLLLANLHLYAYTGDKVYLEEINFIVSCLITRINYGEKGVYWNRLKTQISGLCGFSHGGSGIGWVLAELGHYFGVDFFNGIARQTVFYEDIFFDKTTKNWAELRVDLYPDTWANEQIVEYEQKKGDMYSNVPAMHAWCHGAAGIGMARRRLYEINGDRKLKQQTQTALTSTIAYCDTVVQGQPSYTLCHGVGGSAYLLIDCYRHTKTPELLEKIRGYGAGAMAQKNNKGHYALEYRVEKEKDPGLFNGLAGIGYFYLQCFDPLDTALDILQPLLKKREVGAWAYNAANEQMLRTVFPRTMELIRQTLTAAELESISVNCYRTDLRKELVRSMKEIVQRQLPGKALADALRYEIKVITRNRRDVNNAMLFTYNSLKQRIAHQFTEAQVVASLQLVCCSSCSLVRSDFNWTGNDHDGGSAVNYTVLLQTHVGVAEMPVGTLESIVCKLSTEKRTVNEIVDEINAQYAVDGENGELGKAIHGAIFSLIKKGILIPGEYLPGHQV